MIREGRCLAYCQIGQNFVRQGNHSLTAGIVMKDDLRRRQWPGKLNNAHHLLHSARSQSL